MNLEATHLLSVALLDVLRDPRSDEKNRQEAFTQMLSLHYGWWGDRRLYTFAMAVARGFTRSRLAQYGIPIDRLDYEGVANESLAILYRRATEIHGNPRSWLIGTIRNLIRQEIKREWQHLINGVIPDDQLVDELEDEAVERVGELEETLTDAIRRLPSSIRVIAEMLYIHRVPREKLPEALGLSEDAVRKRIFRGRKALQDAARNKTKDSRDTIEK
jgi:RNA polymerase sigma factor (sigma-70 family)